jgi:hypothetical protein
MIPVPLLIVIGVVGAVVGAIVLESLYFIGRNLLRRVDKKPPLSESDDSAKNNIPMGNL